MEQKVISVCKRTKRSTWAGNQAKRNNDAGMKMMVIHTTVGGKKSSKTVYSM